MTLVSLAKVLEQHQISCELTPDGLNLVSINNQVFNWRTRPHETIQKVTLKVHPDHIEGTCYFFHGTQNPTQERTIIIATSASNDDLISQINNLINS